MALWSYQEKIKTIITWNQIKIIVNSILRLKVLQHEAQVGETKELHNNLSCKVASRLTNKGAYIV